MNPFAKLRDKTLPVEVKASAAYTVCSIFQRSLPFITLPMFTRLLTTEQYGQTTIYQSWMSILVIFLTLNLPYGSFNTAMVKFEGRRDSYVSAINGLCTVLAAAFLLIVYLPFRSAWNGLFELPTALVVFMVLEALMTNATQLWMGKQRFEFRYRKVIAVTVATSIASPVLSFALVMAFQERGYARIVGNSLVAIGCGLILYLVCLRRGKAFYSRDFWKYALSFNVPLIPYYLSQTVFNQSDRIMISHMVGTDMAAVYGIGYTMGILLTFVLNSINNAYVPWFYGKLKDGRGVENRRVSLYIAALMAVLLFGVTLVTPEAILILAGEQYAEAVWVVPPVAMSTLLLFYAQLFINVEFFYEKKALLVVATAGAAVLNVALNFLLIPVFGFVAAAYTTLASYLLFAGCNYLAYRRTVREEGIAADMYDMRALTLLFVAFAAFCFGAMALYGVPVARYAVAVALVALVFVFRKKIRAALGALRGGSAEGDAGKGAE